MSKIDIVYNEHRVVVQLINTYKKEFDEFRPLHLKSIGQNGTSSYKTWYELDENQVTFLLKRYIFFIF